MGRDCLIILVMSLGDKGRLVREL
ncbi:hypothetical protein SCOCK_90102 [Actinacidiphila cocklensis]|uniref:Uncharacterized protein n=1 Tax=Actinacidiphila cocklensis TaxID=887465 RepID=A0A9W4DXF2_9ACTN|nr:hypothetical protein SCOCK_90102 [Actinacidiphila cocklensis]